jgi:8-oxo-dGTP pyrophosphatase MutT (NUDIX family)
MQRLPLPPQLVQQAAEYADGSRTPVEPRDAATVVLLRSSESGPEVYLLRRQTSMAFAAGMCVFPGGGVDPRDFDHSVAWAGPSPAEWASRLGTDERMARALVCAAVRETFEESGVLLAGFSADSVVADTTGDDWEADRRALLDRSQSFGGFLDRRGLVLRADLLRPWAHWITPAIEPKRYDTRFFVAAMPEGQRARDVSTEADEVAWVRPAEAAERAAKGEWMMLPPTVATLAELAEFDTVADVLAARREIVVHEPTAEIIDGEAYLVLPDGVERHYRG